MKRVWIDHVSDLNATASTVCSQLQNIDRWSEWTPDLAAVFRRSKRPFGVGSMFVMVLRRGLLPPVVLPCVVYRWEPTVIEWGGGVGGSRIRHRFEISDLGDGRCRVRQVEEASGFFGLIALPVEPLIASHDRAWSVALERQFI